MHLTYIFAWTWWAAVNSWKIQNCFLFKIQEEQCRNRGWAMQCYDAEAIFKFVSLSYLILSVLHSKVVWYDKRIKYKNQSRKKMPKARIYIDHIYNIHKFLKHLCKVIHVLQKENWRESKTFTKILRKSARNKKAYFWFLMNPDFAMRQHCIFPRPKYSFLSRFILLPPLLNTASKYVIIIWTMFQYIQQENIQAMHTVLFLFQQQLFLSFFIGDLHYRTQTHF